MAENLKEYVVTLHRHEDLDDFYDDMETPGGNLHIPDRKVDLANRRPLSRNTHYLLTPEEAEQVRNDSRVWDIVALENIPPDIPAWVENSNNFSKSPNTSTDRNWALKRVIEGRQDGITWYSNSSSRKSGYVFAGSEGENVDVVIFDGIVDPTHPEYAVNSDGTGVSRVQPIDWNSYIGKTTPYDYNAIRTAQGTGSSGHGAHVAGTVAGNRQGWARKSNIYNIDVYTSLEGAAAGAWDRVLAWNAAKPINPVTGRRNPTVTNHSYGNFYTNISISDINWIEYRGTTYTSADWGSWGIQEWARVGFWLRGSQVYAIAAGPYASKMADEDTAISSGIVVVAAAGNGRHIWATSPAHPDWNNKVNANIPFLTTKLPYTLTYCRGVSHSYNAIIAGSVDSAYGNDRYKERVNDMSGIGEGVTVFSPGTNIISADYNGFTDSRNTSYKLSSKSGTSMASPQVAGVAACILSKYQTYTPAQVKQYIIDNATLDQIEDPNGWVFTTPQTPNRYLYYPADLNSGIIPTATITPTKTSVNEGETVEFEIATEYLLSGTTLNWRIVSSTGTITALDFEEGQLSGTLTLDPFRNGYLSLTLSADRTTENTEKFYLELKTTTGTVVGNSPIITINDTSLTKSYSLSANKTSVDEGSSVTFTVNTTSVDPGTSLVWNIKNYSDYSFDIDALTGTVFISGTLSSGTGSFSVYITEDFLTEGPETFEVEVRENSLTGPVIATSSVIVINDTSQNPTYSISDPDKTNVNEGETVSFTVTTTGVPVGTVLYWTTTGAINAADFSDNSLTGIVTISGSKESGTGTIARTLVADRLTEGFESFYLNLKVGSITGATVATSGGVVVYDTSLSPTYTLTADKTVTNEYSNIKITLNTTDVDDNTLVPYAIYGPTIDPTDFIDRLQLTGNFNVIGNKSSFVLTINPDNVTEGDEIAYVKLTGPNRTETVGFTIEDTSTTPPDDTVYFYITSSTGAIREGNYLTFTVAAVNIDRNITVPYELLGIPAEDLLDPTQISGNVSLIYDPDASIVTGESGDLVVPADLPPVVTGVASAQLTVGIIENFKTDGLRTVLLNLTPDYNYEIKISSSIQIIDISVETEPKYYFNFDKYSLIEGSNLLIRLDTMNVPANTIVTADIIAYSNSKITLSDFVGLSNLSITFPPTSNSRLVLTPEIPGDFSYGEFANAAVFTLQTADDFVFEQTEFFYFAVRGTQDTSGVIELLDSGNSLIEAKQIFTGNAYINLLDKAELQANLGGFTIAKSMWEDTSGMLSEKIFVQGKNPGAGSQSAPFYQPFSYVIRSNKSIDLWRKSIKDMIHPVGLALFSEISNETQHDAVLDVSSKATIDSEISDFFALTADNRQPPFYVSSNVYSNDRFEVYLKSDFAYYIHKYF